MPLALDDMLLARYTETFYGYGQYEAPYWFVGLEEGSNGTAEEIERRLLAWRQGGCRELEDARDFHIAIGAETLTRERPRLQATWKQLCRVVLIATMRPADMESVRRYQGQHLGRLNG